MAAMQADSTQSRLQVVEERMHVLNYHTGIMVALGLLNEPVAYRNVFVSCDAVLSLHTVSVRLSA